MPSPIYVTTHMSLALIQLTVRNNQIHLVYIVITYLPITNYQHQQKCLDTIQKVYVINLGVVIIYMDLLKALVLK
jgi:hypothetical protein